MTSDDVLWTPSEHFRKESNLYHFQQWLAIHKDIKLHSAAELWQWSVKDVAFFWECIVEYFKVKFHTQPQKTIEGEHMPDINWFVGGTLSYSEHIFRQYTDERPALIFANEKISQEISWADLQNQVLRLQDYLIAVGVKKGDRVVAYLPNIPEAIVAFLAVNGLGAIWSCCSPDFGMDTVLARFGQIEPKVIIGVDGYQYNGKPYDRTEDWEALCQQLPTLAAVVYIPYRDSNYTMAAGTAWQDIMSRETSISEIHFEAVAFNHPIWVLFSSGTTGKPKAITHSHGGMLLEHLKYISFHNDVHAGEHYFWYSTTGWMMWNFLQATMLVGAVPVLYDGSPAYPNMDVLWKMTTELPIHHFGTSAPYLVACMNRDLTFGKKHDLSQLRSISSTGAPLPPEAFDYVYRSIKPDVWLCSMSGGTDVCTAFVGGHPYKPVRRGRIQARALGVSLKAYDESAQAQIGQLGEMVIDKPMPSMPIYFWNDEHKKRYRASYFEEYGDVWQHGDWIDIERDGSLIILGRSDATLNRNGVRIGTAEIYNILEHIDAISDSLIINIEKEDGSSYMPLFLTLKAGQRLDNSLQDQINHSLRTSGSPRHVPDDLILCPDIPYTLSGKKMEVPIKKLCLPHLDYAINMESVRNPESIAFFQSWASEWKKSAAH